ITQQVEQDVRPLMLRHQATLSTAISHTLPRVLADADQLWRVIENLISNAIAHNTPGIRILITADLVTSTRTGTIVCCKIIDDGVGISQEQQQRLFEPYQQGQKNSPGLGLGLYICRRIVEAHDGTLGVLSQPGAGATFWFTLPIA
ncbi:MAG: ATP-binding protein, partial [Cyanobacteria bacterium P01_A01_bin.135]